MSDEHKVAVAEGTRARSSGAALSRSAGVPSPQAGSKAEARQHHETPGRHRQATRDGRSLNRLHLVPERLDLERELGSGEGGGVDRDELEGAFIEVAAASGGRKGLSYQAWRSIAVAPGS